MTTLIEGQVTLEDRSIMYELEATSKRLRLKTKTKLFVSSWFEPDKTKIFTTTKSLRTLLDRKDIPLEVREDIQNKGITEMIFDNVPSF